MFDQRKEERFTTVVVDDNKAVRQFVAKLLRLQGHRTFEASCGAKALEVVQRHERPVDLLLTDVEMPGMDASHCTGKCASAGLR